MKRDVVVVKLADDESLIIASDNSGAIGEKQADLVGVPYDVIGYYSFRVAVMECMAARATPLSVVIHNFCNDEAWDALVQGVMQGKTELSLDELPITGSTESNFELLQSAVGTIVIGTRGHQTHDTFVFSTEVEFAVIGSPLIGDEVVEWQDEIAPLPLFKWCCEQPGILAIMPVGSKGILSAVNQLAAEQTGQLTAFDVSGALDLVKSSGPATCFIIAYNTHSKKKISDKCERFFHPLKIKTC